MMSHQIMSSLTILSLIVVCCAQNIRDKTSFKPLDYGHKVTVRDSGNSMDVYWDILGQSIEVMMVGPTTGYVSVGWCEAGSYQTVRDTLAAYCTYFAGGVTTAGAAKCWDMYDKTSPTGRHASNTPFKDNRSGGTDNLIDCAGALIGGKTFVKFTRKLVTGDNKQYTTKNLGGSRTRVMDTDIENRNQRMIWAYGPDGAHCHAWENQAQCRNAYHPGRGWDSWNWFADHKQPGGGSGPSPTPMPTPPPTPKPTPTPQPTPTPKPTPMPTPLPPGVTAPPPTPAPTPQPTPQPSPAPTVMETTNTPVPTPEPEPTPAPVECGTFTSKGCKECVKANGGPGFCKWCPFVDRLDCTNYDVPCGGSLRTEDTCDVSLPTEMPLPDPDKWRSFLARDATNYVLRWNYEDGVISFQVSADVQGYVAVGWSRKPVLQAIAHEDIDVYTCYIDEEGNAHVIDSYGEFDVTQPTIDETSSVIEGSVSGAYLNGRTLVNFQRRIRSNPSDIEDVSIEDRIMFVGWAVGEEKPKLPGPDGLCTAEGDEYTYEESMCYKRHLDSGATRINFLLENDEVATTTTAPTSTQDSGVENNQTLSIALLVAVVTSVVV